MKPLIWGERKTEYFSQQIWTGVIDLKARMKLFFWRKPFRGGNGLRRRHE
jgi:hypothetical protein